jgi:hypothetical protein
MATTCGNTATMGGSEDLIIDASGPNLHHNRGDPPDPGFHSGIDFDSDVSLDQELPNQSTNSVVANGTQSPESVQLGLGPVPASQIVASFTFNASSGHFNPDDFTLDNTADTAARSYQLAPGQITGHGGGSVTYMSTSSGTFTIRLEAGTAGDEIAVQPDTSADPPYAFEVDAGGGDDRVTPQNGAPVPTYDGDLGTDTLSFAGYSTAATFSLPGPTTSVENLLGGSAGDSLTGDASANRIEGAGGADSLSGGDGDDVLAAADGLADASLDCGPGAADVANVDAALDPAPTGCETVNRIGEVPPDPDADGDGVPDASDACPAVPGSPSDNGCPPEAPGDRDGDGVADTADRCPDSRGPAPVGCPAVERKLTLGRGKGEFEGKLKSTPDVLSCEEGQKVTVLRKKKGRDPKVGDDRTNGKGAYEVDGRGRHGKYYALVKETDEAPAAICLEARSRNLALG